MGGAIAGAAGKTAAKTAAKQAAKKAAAQTAKSAVKKSATSGAKNAIKQNLKEQGLEWAKQEAVSRAQAIPGQIKEGAMAMPGRAKAAGAAAIGAAGGGIRRGAGHVKGFFHGAGSNPNKSFMIIIFVFAFLSVGVFVFWFVRSGGLQTTGSNQFVADKQTEQILESNWLKRMTNWFENPFGVRAASGEYEEVDDTTQASTSAPNQAFSINVKATPAILPYDQSAVTAIITVKNEGSTELKQIDLNITSEHPIYNNYDAEPARKERCFRFENENIDAGCKWGDEFGEVLTCKLFDIPPFSSKQIVLTGGRMDYDCVYGIYGVDFKPDVPTEGFISVYGTTYYPTSSRLAVERIKTDYGVLLIQNNLLRQESRGSIYQTGTAMQIDLDIGEQPILESVDTGGLLFSWVEVGNGKLDNRKSPFLFMITPGDFGKCVPQGITATGNLAVCNSDDILLRKGLNDKDEPIGLNCIICDEDLFESYSDSGKGIDLPGWCVTTSPVYKQIALHAATIKESFDWACGLVGQKDENGNLKYHVCATNTLSSEFSTMSCGMSLKEPIDANRNTKYITAMALYPYRVEAPLTTVSAYCIEGSCPVGGG